MTQNPAESDTKIDLAKLIKEFHAARGQEDDVDWVRTAAGRLMLDGVKVSAAKKAFTELLPVLNDAQEPAEELFGDPKVWAKEQQEHWQQSGTPAQDRYQLYSFKRLTQTICFSASLLSVVVTIVALIDDGWTTKLSWAMFGLPLFFTTIAVGLAQFWNLAVRKFTRLMAMLWTAMILAVSVITLAGLIIALQGSPGTASVLWYLAPVPMYALFYYLIEKLAKRNYLAPRSTSSKTEVATHEEWISQLQETSDFGMTSATVGFVSSSKIPAHSPSMPRHRCLRNSARRKATQPASRPTPHSAHAAKHWAGRLEAYLSRCCF